jgi:dihydroorotate dehydrogenase (NAD+) catalytic subunit
MFEPNPFRQELTFSTPWMNAAGTSGFSPRTAWNFPQPAGVFVTAPFSITERQPAGNRACLRFPGGILLHNGLPNPGLNAVLAQYANAWKRSSLPVWAHILPQDPTDCPVMLRALEETEGISAIELGLPPGCNLSLAGEYAKAAVCELPLVIHLSMTEITPGIAKLFKRTGISAISLGAPRGCLVDENGHPVTGRLYGPAILPFALAAVRNLREVGLPVIASGGVYSLETGQALLAAGAVAVQIDTLLWRGG